MLLISKDAFVHVGLEAESTALTLPAGLYTAEYNARQTTTTFEDATRELGPYYDLERDVQDVIRDEVEYFFTQTKQRGVLVHGGPGNGKTRMLCEEIIQACARHNAVALIGPDLDWMTQIIEAVRADDKDRPIIVFWDEFDELMNRSEYDLLRFLDGANSFERVLTVAALNDLDEVPERIYKRPGRFGLVAALEQPGIDERLLFLKGRGAGDAALRIAQVTEGLSLDYVREVADRHLNRGQRLEDIFKRLKLDWPESPEITDYENAEAA